MVSKTKEKTTKTSKTSGKTSKHIKPKNVDKPETKISNKEENNIERYVEAIGRRKTSTVRVRGWINKKGITINDITLEQYFPNIELQEKLLEPLKLTDMLNKIGITIKVSGGGLTGQAEASRLGIARLLDKMFPDTNHILRVSGMLTRDPRKVERKKYGLHKARRAPQWRKR